MTDTQYAGMDGTPYPPAAAAATEPTDTFTGDNTLLVNCMRSLINLDAAGALVPHGIGAHARGLLEAAAVRLASAGWIDVRDRMPEPEVEVLTRHRHPGGEWQVGPHEHYPDDIGTPSDFGCAGWLYGSAENVETSHWMPMPSTDLGAPVAREPEVWTPAPLESVPNCIDASLKRAASLLRSNQHAGDAIDASRLEYLRTSFNPAEGSPATALQMAAVIAHRDATPVRLIPPGFALVPLRMTREMQRAVEAEDWHWRDVLEAAGTVTEAQCEQASEEPAGLPVEQEPKYTVDGAHIVNRASGEAIPHDEPVFILRARDEVAHHAIAAYASELRGREPVSHHREAVIDRLRHFLDFATAHPDRLKWPDTAPTFSEAGLSRLAAAVKGDA